MKCQTFENDVSCRGSKVFPTPGSKRFPININHITNNSSYSFFNLIVRGGIGIQKDCTVFCSYVAARAFVVFGCRMLSRCRPEGLLESDHQILPICRPEGSFGSGRRFSTNIYPSSREGGVGCAFFSTNIYPSPREVNQSINFCHNGLMGKYSSHPFKS